MNKVLRIFVYTINISCLIWFAYLICETIFGSVDKIFNDAFFVVTSIAYVGYIISSIIIFECIWKVRRLYDQKR